MGALLLGSGSGSAAPVLASGPPFSGSSAAIFSHSGPTVLALCGHAGFSSKPRWNASTGGITWSGGTEARASGACSAPIMCSPNTSCSYVDVRLTVPFPSPTSSSRHNVTAIWTLQANDSWKVLPHGPCPAPRLSNGTGFESCNVAVTVWLSEPTVSLVDLTNGTSLCPGPRACTGPLSYANGSWYSHDESCVSTACTNRTNSSADLIGGERLSATFYNRWSSVLLNSTHSYELSYRFEGGVTTNLARSGNYWGASAFGWLDLADGTNGLYLDQIVLT